MAYKMKGYSYPGKSPMKGLGGPEGDYVTYLRDKEPTEGAGDKTVETGGVFEDPKTESTTRKERRVEKRKERQEKKTKIEAIKTAKYAALDARQDARRAERDRREATGETHADRQAKKYGIE